MSPFFLSFVVFVPIDLEQKIFDLCNRNLINSLKRTYCKQNEAKKETKLNSEKNGKKQCREERNSKKKNDNPTR